MSGSAKATLVRTLLANGTLLTGKKCTINGTVKRVRSLKQNYFLAFNDGSHHSHIQVVVPTCSLESKIHNGDVLKIEGHLAMSEGGQQEVEFVAQRVVKISGSSESFPLSNSHKMSLDMIRRHPHLQSRADYFQSMTRLRSAAEWAMHEFFQKHNFVKISTPVITSNDCEGAGECFLINSAVQTDKTKEKPSVDADGGSGSSRRLFFSTPTQLTVSGQLHLEAMINGLGNVYTFGPTFRAEHSRTIRHLAEFYMVEAEMAFVDNLHAVMENAESCLKYAIERLLCENHHLLKYLWTVAKDGVHLDAKQMRTVLESDFVRLSFAEAIGVLNSDDPSLKLNMRSALKREHELALTEKFKLPVFVYNYPVGQKAFYARQNDSVSKTCASFDLLVPRVSELAGGSLREDRLDKLESRMREVMDEDAMSALDWYLDLRRFGSIPHGGYGIGFERFLLWISGSSNIRNTIPFPRYIDSCPM